MTCRVRAGASLGVAYWFTSFANPAQHLGRTLSDTVAGIVTSSALAPRVSRYCGDQ